MKTATTIREDDDVTAPTLSPPVPLTEARALSRKLLSALGDKPNRVRLAENSLRAARQRRVEASERLASAINAKRAAGAGQGDQVPTAELRSAQAEVEEADRAVTEARQALEAARAWWAPQILAKNDLALRDLQACVARAAADLADALGAAADYALGLELQALPRTARQHDCQRAALEAQGLLRRLKVTP